MTAETLKPFISSPSMSNYVSNPKRNILLIGLSVLFFIIIGGIFGFTIWNTVRVSQLQHEVDSLHKLMDNMQKRLGLDYLDDLNDFEKSYTNNDNDLLDDVNDDDDEDDISDENGDLLDFESDGDYNDEDDFDFEASGDENYDDNDSSNDDKLLDDFEKYIGSKKRKSRSISEINGVPIYRESYAIRRNKTGGPEDEKIARHLLNKKNTSPTLRYDWNDKTPQRTIHQMKSEDKYMEARAGPETVIRLSPRTHMFNGRHIVHHHNHNHEKNINNHIGNRIDNKRDENQHQQQKVQNARPLLKNGGRLRSKSHSGILAVHYNLNRIPINGNYIPKTGGNPMDYRNDDSIYILTPQSWSRNNRLDEAFNNNNGILTIKESGIYYIYAQVFYHNNQDRNGYLIYHNQKPLLQCLISIPDTTEKANTCYTSSAIYLQKDDTIHMKDIYKDYHNAIFGNAKSFLGLIRFGNPIEYNKTNHFL